MKLIKPFNVPKPDANDDVPVILQKAFLERSFDLLSGWLPFSASFLMERYTKNDDPHFRSYFKIYKPYIYVLFDMPWYDKNGKRIETETDADKSDVSLLVGLVFDQNKELIADLALYHFPAEEMNNSAVRNAFEKESDWLYWENYILDETCFKGQKIRKSDEVLLYSNAYTSVDERRQGIFKQLMQLSEAFYADKKSEVTLYSAISLDPDVACYGKDKLDHPYIYSMKDEPDRLRNAKIMESLGYETVHLETDEPVEDGSLLWFAWKKCTWIDLEAA